MYYGSKEKRKHSNLEQPGKLKCPKQNYTELFQVGIMHIGGFITFKEDGFSGQKFHKIFELRFSFSRTRMWFILSY